MEIDFEIDELNIIVKCLEYYNMQADNKRISTQIIKKITEEIKIESDRENSIKETTLIIIDIADKLQEKFPNNKIEWKYLPFDYGSYITIDSEEVYYSREFTEFIGELDFNYLMPKNIHNVFFTVNYK